MPAGSGLRVLELYCGIGGFSAAIGRSAEVVAAVDINRDALEVYARNFPHPRIVALVESLPIRRLAELEADLWWASPPCQPFTRRGLGRDLEDPRAATFRAFIKLVAAVKPSYLALENVEPFAESQARGLLLRALADAGYAQIVEQKLCPSELGVPNRRPRYYLLASRQGTLSAASDRVDRGPQSLAHYLDDEFLDDEYRDGEYRDEAFPHEEASEALRLDDEVARRYRHAIHVVEADEPSAVTGCFTSAYGRSPVRSGSYLATGKGPRLFSPSEVLRLLGFPRGFDLGAPGDTEKERKKKWRLAGNSLSIPAVRHVLSRIPELALSD